jgi:hypothetical protein
MKNLRTSLACLALLASAAACSDANPLTAPGAPRFDGGGFKGSGNITSTEDGGGAHGSGGVVPVPEERGGGHTVGSGG